jgi:hypothetical protein
MRDGALLASNTFIVRSSLDEDLCNEGIDFGGLPEGGAPPGFPEGGFPPGFSPNGAPSPGGESEPDAG